MTQRDGMGREVEGGFRMGNTYTPVANSCQYMAKPIQYCKVISLQKNQLIKKKKKKTPYLERNTGGPCRESCSICQSESCQKPDRMARPLATSTVQ